MDKLDEDIFKIVEQDSNQTFKLLQECNKLRQIHDEVEDIETIDNESNIQLYTYASF